MNDFTKDELQQLKRSVSYHWNEIGEYATDEKRKEFILIKQKIQLLIDNYCEHIEVRSISDANYVYLCNKCEEVIRYE